MPQRPNRVQTSACRAAVAAVLGTTQAEDVLHAAGIAGLPTHLPAGPRNLAALEHELTPFVALYRTLLQRIDRPAALEIVRQAIIDSGLVSHSTAADEQRAESANSLEPLVLTSPPPPGFHAPPEELEQRFHLAMEFFSCSGELLAYTPQLVRFKVTGCNWCAAMHALEAPELIPFFCETDQRFMDHHPTHRLQRPAAIGLGDSCCDFQFVLRNADDTMIE